ncbi:DUF4857 domain-containing protein [uncultured Bacteroides sp.]|uniref:DUF4857 domain-containing protein n=1 Tax=uncultured Bacteroides sp. TaxID=162156 RepID=UPI002AA91CE2|nr:DUF4857 domain-containing protein [uncultured Bacteroides sp.]
MLRFSKILFYFTVILLLLWQLPWCYNFFTAKSPKSNFVLYSSVIDDFVITGRQEGQNGKEGKGIIRRDLSGNKYTQDEVDSILPTFYFRQLMSDERFPDSINGVGITPRLMQTENFVFKIAPTDLNTPHIGLYPLLESMSGRVELEMPKDVFRITGRGIEFVDMATNSIEQTKSALFTEALTKKGFHFPAVEIAGNPTTRKDYDEGYVLLDANRELFHLKQIKGRPYVRAVEVPYSVKLEHLFITEFRNHKTLALMTDMNHSLYVLTTPYEVKKVGIPFFNPEKEAISIIGNMFDWTLRITSLEKENYFAVHANDFSLIKAMKTPAIEETFAQKVGRYIFPVQISFTSALDDFVKPRI